MHPDAMTADQAVQMMTELQSEIKTASTEFDWELVATIDGDVRALAEAFPKSNGHSNWLKRW